MGISNNGDGNGIGMVFSPTRSMDFLWLVIECVAIGRREPLLGLTEV